jgi:spermidine/putrescine-binding protein
MMAPTTLTRRRFSLWTAASVLGMVIPGLSQKAGAATTVNWMGWQGYEDPLAANNYLTKNAVDLKTTYVNTNDDMLTKLRAGGVGTIDLGTIEQKNVALYVRNEVLQPIDPASLSNYKAIMPFFAEQPSLRLDGKLYAVPFTWGMQPMIYRPDMVTEVPSSWRDVMKPQYKGKVVMVGGMIGNIQVWARVVTGTDTPTLITPAQLKETIDFMIKIKKEQARTVAASYGEMVDIMARGEAVISTLGWEPVVKWAAKKGAKVAYVYPKEGTCGFLDCYVLPKNAPNRDLDLKLIDNALSLAGQQLIVDKLGQAIVNTAAIAALSAEDRALYPYDNIAAMAKIARFYPMPPLEPDGVHVTFRDMLKEWDRFKRE